MLLKPKSDMENADVLTHLEQISGLRDKDALDVSLVYAIRDVTKANLVSVYRLHGTRTTGRWVNRATLKKSGAIAEATSSWTLLSDLPLATDHQQRLWCMDAQRLFGWQEGPEFLTVFPLVAGTESVGVVEVRTNGDLPGEAQRAVKSILKVTENVQSTLEDASRDPLTQLLTRRTFQSTFERISPEQMDGGFINIPGEGEVKLPRYFLATLDVDHFKAVNDTHGHQVGDEVLASIARLMMAATTTGDRIYRFGGEEFVVLFRAADDDSEGRRLLETMREMISSYDFPAVGTVTASIGFTLLRRGDTTESAIRRADSALYLAKSNGRNRVEEATEDDQATG